MKGPLSCIALVVVCGLNATASQASPGSTKLNQAGLVGTSIDQGVVRLIVEPDFARGLDDEEHDAWLSRVLGQLEASGTQVSAVYEYVADPTLGLVPLDRILPNPKLPPALRATGQAPGPHQPQRPMYHPHPLPYGGGLLGKTIVVSPGHGLRFANGSYSFQREKLEFDGCGSCAGIIEDLFTSEFAHRHLIPLLLRAGAKVYTPREWDPISDEIIVDNGTPGYAEQGTWTDGVSAGGFQDNYRVLAPGQPGQAEFRPNLPEAGLYWVSARFVAGTNRSDRAKFTIRHAGGTLDLSLDQRNNGSRWLYLGQFWMNPGEGHGVVLSPGDDPSGYVIADAVRFGGGIHVDSGASRWQMAALEHLSHLGAPSQVWDTNDVIARPLYAEWQGADAYLSIHSNATGSVNTVSGTSTYRYNCGTYADHSTAPDPSLCDSPPGSDALQRAVHESVVSTLRDNWDPNWQDRGRRVANFGEVRVLDSIPGALIELAFHDNTVQPTGTNPQPSMPDNRALQEPRWRRHTAWGVYQGLLRFLNGGGATLPATPQIAFARAEEPATIRVGWDAVDSAQAYRVYVARDGRGFDGSMTVSTPEAVISAGEGEPVFVRVASLGAGGESMPSEVLGAAWNASHPVVKHVLVVQGYDREDCWTGEGGNRFDSVIEHGRAIAAAGFGFDSATNEAVTQGVVPLSPYRIVDWALGRESHSDSTFDADERAALRAFATAGGHVLASGTDIGWDLVEKGDADSSQFLLDVFGASYVADDTASDGVVAPQSGILGELDAVQLDDGSKGGYRVDFPDVLTGASAGAQVALLYVNGEHAAVAYDAGARKAFIAGFPLEGATPKAGRDALIAAILKFFEPEGPPQLEEDAGAEPEPETEPSNIEPQPEAGSDGGHDASGAVASPATAGEDDTGCSCRTGARGAESAAAWLVAAMASWLGLRRRRASTELAPEQGLRLPRSR